MLIQALVYPNFTAMDLVGALQPLALLPGAEVELVCEQPGPVPTDAGVSFVAEASYASASRRPDVLLVPGGGAPSVDILEDEQAMSFLARQGVAAEWIVAVCTGSLLLGMAGLLKGYRAASHWAVIDTLDAFGATPVHDRVVIDRNRCTGGGVTAGVDIGFAMAGRIAGRSQGKVLELAFEYNPAPPFGTGHPSLADAETYRSAKALTDSVYPVDHIRRLGSRMLTPSAQTSPPT